MVPPAGDLSKESLDEIEPGAGAGRVARRLICDLLGILCSGETPAGYVAGGDPGCLPARRRLVIPLGPEPAQAMAEARIRAGGLR